jgi:hypothetical protein
VTDPRISVGRISVRDAGDLARSLAFKGVEGTDLRAALLGIVDAAYGLREAHEAECGCTRPGDPAACVWPPEDGRLLARFDFGDDDDGPGSIPGLPAGPLGPQPVEPCGFEGMGGTGLEPVPPNSDIGAGSGTEGPEKAIGAGDSEDPERPLAVSTGPDRTPGIGASGSNPGLVRCPTGLACTGCRYCEPLWEAVGR